MEDLAFIPVGTAIGLLLMVLSVTLINFFTAPMLARAPMASAWPKVSILIPARNEAQNIGTCLEGLRRQDYPILEILVLDDHSADDTAGMVQAHQKEDSRIQLLTGQPLPSGWTGKNWACHQLSQAAEGEILIFTDADNRHAPFAVRHTVAYMQKWQLGLLSAFPQQETRTLAEKLVVPIMDIFVYGVLPLWLTYRAHYPSLAAANGQWIAFTRAAYHTIGGHETVRGHLVEDTELSRLAKKKKISILTTAGTGAVFCRMYQNASQVWEGFSKNFYGLTGYNNFAFFGIILALFFGFILPYFIWIIPSVRMLALVGIALNIGIRLLLALKYRHPLLASIVLHPVGIAWGILIGLNSFISFRKGMVRWKDREILLSHKK